MFTRVQNLLPPEREIVPKESLSLFLQSIHPIYPVLCLPPAKFKNSKFDTEPDLDAFTESFDKGLKHTFSEKKPQFVKFGSARDNDGRCDVRDGRLTLQGWGRSVRTGPRKLKRFLLLRAGPRSQKFSDHPLTPYWRPSKTLQETWIQRIQ